MLAQRVMARAWILGFSLRIVSFLACGSLSLRFLFFPLLSTGFLYSLNYCYVSCVVASVLVVMDLATFRDTRPRCPSQLGFRQWFCFFLFLTRDFRSNYCPFLLFFSFLFVFSVGCSDTPSCMSSCCFLALPCFVSNLHFSYPERVTQNSSRVTLDGLHFA